jgi:uncharacterized protein
VPVFIGFVEGGVPLGVTFSFLIASPMVNEVALILLFGYFGLKIAAIYIVAGLAVAVVGGLVIGRIGLESEVEEYVYSIKVAEATVIEPTWPERLTEAWDYTLGILAKVWIWVIVGIAIGAAIHGWAPSDFLVRYAGPNNPLAVPLAVLIGIPLYSNAGGIIPIVGVLVEKGLPMGTVLAFMMAVTALSLPELIILRKVLKPKLLTIFVAINAVTITLVGYLFNWILG